MTTILVVDDSPVDRAVVAGFLEPAGFTVQQAENGEDALVCVEHNRPDLVLTDMKMPVMDGLALVKAMRTSYAEIPVILMTAHGSEETAVAALHAGAAHYVPKASLQQDLVQAVTLVCDVAVTSRTREKVRSYLQHQEMYYQLGYDASGPRALIGHLQDALKQMSLCGESDLIRVGTALTEALANAIDHGNLDLDSSIRSRSTQEYRALGDERSRIPPYCDRRVHVTVRMTLTDATFVVRDEGRGFDVASLPDPTDPQNLTRASGRGVMLIRTFMDDVRFNARGNEITMVLTHRPDETRAA